MIVFARDYNRKNKAVPADPSCSGVPGFPYTRKQVPYQTIKKKKDVLEHSVVSNFEHVV